MTSGYTSCPCCGFDTISSDDNRPELCSDCSQAGCDPSGCDPRHNDGGDSMGWSPADDEPTYFDNCGGL